MNNTTVLEATCPECPWCSTTPVGLGVLALFRAPEAAKMASISLPTVRIKRAGPTSSNPGGLWLISDLDAEYLGKITVGGEIRMTRAGQSAGVSEALRRLSAFGADELARVGRACGRCCYCARVLTDPQSMDLGYGPVCARYHGLPHPNRHGF